MNFDTATLKKAEEAFRNNASALQHQLNELMRNEGLTDEQKNELEKAKLLNLDSLNNLKNIKEKLKNDFNI